jgi:hypothetical protein
MEKIREGAKEMKKRNKWDYSMLVLFYFSYLGK